MLCTLDSLLRGCLKERTSKTPKRVALLIEGFPRPNHPIVEFAKLLYLLRVHGAKATFVVDWQEIRQRGLSASVAEMVKLLRHNEHEIGIKFKTSLFGGSRLNQNAVEALHFLQRVYGVNVVSVKVGKLPTTDHEALTSLGLTVVDCVPNQIVVQDTDNVLTETAIALEAVYERQCVCIRDLTPTR